MNKKSVFTCETCSALYVCLKYFQEHRRSHYDTLIYPCSHCVSFHESQSQATLHAYSHTNEPPHSCDICRPIDGISEEQSFGTRRSVGTVTDFHKSNLHIPTINDNFNAIDDGVEDVGNEEEEDDDDIEDEEDEEEEEEEDEEDEDEDMQINQDQQNRANCKVPNVTNIIYVTNNTINHTTTTTTNTQPRNSTKPTRPSRSTGKGKGNRKARLTTDGDIRRKFSCCHCGKSFKTKSHLQRHILTHTGEKPYHCNRCDCRFNQSSSLRNHVIAIHTKEYPHTCLICNKGFLMPALLQKHLQITECGNNSQIEDPIFK